METTRSSELVYINDWSYIVPKYLFRNIETNEFVEHSMKIAEYDQFKADNPHLERYIEGAAAFSYTGPGDFDGKKSNAGWKEMLSKIAAQNPSSPLAERYGRRDAKAAKTHAAIERQIKRQEQRTKK